MSINYHYIFRKTKKHDRVLDFGCGFGGLLQVAHEHKSIDKYWGADTFETIYENWSQQVPKDYQDRVGKIVDGVIPHETDTFDCVVSNMVFEHIESLEEPLKEIKRVLKNGGALVCLFPAYETAYEGHAGVFFAHFLLKFRPAMRLYLKACHKLGFGLYQKNQTADQWADRMVKTLSENCYYHHKKEVYELMTKIFGSEIVSFEDDLLKFRISSSRLPDFLKKLMIQAVPKVIQKWFYQTRGSLAFSIKNSE